MKICFALLASVVMLASCDENKTVKQNLDDTGKKVDSTLTEVRDSTKSRFKRFKENMKNAGDSLEKKF